MASSGIRYGGPCPSPIPTPAPDPRPKSNPGAARGRLRTVGAPAVGARVVARLPAPHGGAAAGPGGVGAEGRGPREAVGIGGKTGGVHVGCREGAGCSRVGWPLCGGGEGMMGERSGNNAGRGEITYGSWCTCLSRCMVKVWTSRDANTAQPVCLIFSQWTADCSS